MIELVHDQRQIHILHSSMISPGLPQAMCTKVTSQAHLLANGCYEFPSLTTPDGSGVIIGLRVEKPEVVWITGNVRISNQIFSDGFTDTFVDENLMMFAPFPLFEPKAFFLVCFCSSKKWTTCKRSRSDIRNAVLIPNTKNNRSR